MRAWRLIGSLVVLAMLGGCASGEAFVDRNYMVKSTKKQKLPGYDGNVMVCFDSASPREQRDALADEACQVYGLHARLVSERKWQCRLTVPHLANYHCIDPQMRQANGGYIDPFSNTQVENWQRGSTPAQAPNGTDQAAPTQ